MIKTANRIEWIDALKGYAIFCVTLGHLGCHIFLEKHIYSFHMFLFFFLSGCVDNTENISFKKYLLKKTKRILVPFVAWNILSNLIDFIRGKGLIETVKTTLLLNGEICWNSPIWFLLVIFITQILHFVLKRFLKIREIVIMAISLLVWVIIPQRNILLKLNLIPMAMLFFTAGIEMKNNLFKGNKFQLLVKKHLVICFFALIILASVNVYFGVFQNIRIVYTKAKFGNLLYTLVAAVSGISLYVILFQLFDFLGNNRLLRFLGENSLLIMASQFYLFTLYNTVAGFNIYLLRNTPKAFIMCIGTITVICLVAIATKYLGRKNKTIRYISAWFGI